MSTERKLSEPQSPGAGKHACPEEVAIRAARSADAPAIARLMSELGYATAVEAMTERLKVLLHHPDYQTLVAEDAGQVVGMLGLARGWYYERDGAYARVLALVVTASRRGHGIGAALLRAGEAWASQAGAAVMILNSGPQRRDAHRFYRHMGFENTGYRFVKRIGPEAESARTFPPAAKPASEPRRARLSRPPHP